MRLEHRLRSGTAGADNVCSPATAVLAECVKSRRFGGGASISKNVLVPN
jgi:hypothetical protein